MKSMTDSQDAALVERLARTAVDRAIEEDRSRRGFTITKFGRHGAGFYHARVTVDGNAIYVHRRFGSWMCPGVIEGRTVVKEVEALLVGTSCEGRGKEVKEALQSRVHSAEKALRVAARREGNS